MEHEMILFSADFKTVHARLAAKRKKAPEAQKVERDTRNVEETVRFGPGAPDEPEAA